MNVGNLVQLTRESVFANTTPLIGTIVRLPLPIEGRSRLHHSCWLVQVGSEKRPRHIQDESQMRLLGQDGPSMAEIEEIWKSHREAGQKAFEAAAKRAAKEAEERKARA